MLVMYVLIEVNIIDIQMCIIYSHVKRESEIWTYH